MSKHSCKYCNRKMNVSTLAYKSNSYCNVCFDERVKSSTTNKVVNEDVFEYNGFTISL